MKVNLSMILDIFKNDSDDFIITLKHVVFNGILKVKTLLKLEVPNPPL